MIRVKLAYLLLDNQAKLKELSEATGIAMNNLSVLKTNKARAIRFSTLEAICKAMQCQPGDLLEYVEDEAETQST
jgi:putative transcriptional regulator